LNFPSPIQTSADDSSRQRLRIAADIGGTFTDLCVFDEDHSAVRVHKVPTSRNPIDGVLGGIEELGADLADVVLVCHSTTVATNALIQRTFPPTGLVTTEGFRDVIEIRRGTKEDLWDLYIDPPPPYVARRHRLTVTERIDATGAVETPLDEEGARRAARLMTRMGLESVAVCFINSYANPAHERRMGEILAEEAPTVQVSLSSQVLPEIFEHERFSTTVVNAVLGPIVTRYVRRLDDELRERGYRGGLLLLHSGGGVVTPAGVEQVPARLTSSGLAAGAIACREIAASAGYVNAIGFDMGGTSTDISLVHQGDLRTTTNWSVEYGYPIALPAVEVLTIGAGGGSIARVDEAGSLRSGPESAGADPGPASYAMGGVQPTTTDANLVLGRLDDRLAGGQVRLDRGLAAKAIDEHVGETIGFDTVEAAKAIIQIANARMADAVRVISIRRGYDPRDFALVAFGGAGPLHGVALARDLSIPTVIVPPYPGVSAAFGCLLVDIQHDLTTTLIADAASADPGDLSDSFTKLEEDALGRLATEGVSEEAMSLHRTLDMRYVGQWRSLGIAVPPGNIDLAQLVRAFHSEHDAAYSFSRLSSPVEIYRIAVRAVGRVPKPRLPQREPDPGAELPRPTATREVHFDDVALETPVYSRDELGPGLSLSGPAIVEQLDSTTLVPPGARLTVDEHFNLVIKVVS
jgi:N-methylhydantoinase A